MKITKREIIVSIAIISVMLIIGFTISEKITNYQNDKNAEYQKAVHITDTELFQYGMETNVGNAFVYGNLKAVGTVTFDEIGGEYLYVKKIEEWYERHEKKVKKKDKDGKEYTDIEVYYEWETKKLESKHVDEIEFCGIVFPYEKINLPSDQHIETISGGREWSWKSGERVKVRFRYYGTSAEHTGTIYTKLSDNTISDNTPFYKNCTIEKVLEMEISNSGNIAFWIAWIFLIELCVYGFCCLDNRWLEDKKIQW